MLFIIAFFSLIGLVVLHELGHFLMAKKFGVRVEEFGIGLPPRLFGKRIGETLYSLNLLPLGAFVKLTGEEGQSSDPRSFGAKSLFQRAIIVGAGVVAFWVISFFIFTGLAATRGIPVFHKSAQRRRDYVEYYAGQSNSFYPSHSTARTASGRGSPWDTACA